VKILLVSGMVMIAVALHPPASRRVSAVKACWS
jgi:hypothetical protein